MSSFQSVYLNSVSPEIYPEVPWTWPPAQNRGPCSEGHPWVHIDLQNIPIEAHCLLFNYLLTSFTHQSLDFVLRESLPKAESNLCIICNVCIYIYIPIYMCHSCQKDCESTSSNVHRSASSKCSHLQSHDLGRCFDCHGCKGLSRIHRTHHNGVSSLHVWLRRASPFNCVWLWVLSAGLSCTPHALTLLRWFGQSVLPNNLEPI